MKITICIGSSCHLKGSRQIVDELQRLVKENQLSDKIGLQQESVRFMGQQSFEVIREELQKAHF